MLTLLTPEKKKESGGDQPLLFDLVVTEPTIVRAQIFRIMHFCFRRCVSACKIVGASYLLRSTVLFALFDPTSQLDKYRLITPSGEPVQC